MRLHLSPRRTGKTTKIIEQYLDSDLIGAKSCIIASTTLLKLNIVNQLHKMGHHDVKDVYDFNEFCNYGLLGKNYDYILMDDLDQMDFKSKDYMAIRYHSNKIIAYSTTPPKGLSKKLYENSG